MPKLSSRAIMRYCVSRAASMRRTVIENIEKIDPHLCGVESGSPPIVSRLIVLPKIFCRAPLTVLTQLEFDRQSTRSRQHLEIISCGTSRPLRRQAALRVAIVWGPS
jgi:hypothetical protein